MEHRIWLLMFAAVMSSGARSQSMGYLDAETPMGAVSMFVVTMRAAEFMESKCKSLFPDKSAKIDADLALWRETEAVTISKAVRLWPQIIAREPEVAELSVYSVEMLKKQMDSILGMPGGRGTAVLEEVCSRHFAVLASGAWRKRTPKAYEFIDRLP
jgi:hypothetical protein